jgi:hypothetical protein
MKLNVVPRSNVDAETTRWYREIATQVNGLSEGRMSASYTALTAAPTSGTWTQGDMVKNSNPSELGTAGSKYVIHGWQCLAGGTPGTWVECRYLTGN